jgi:hypothetical protein
MQNNLPGMLLLCIAKRIFLLTLRKRGQRTQKIMGFMDNGMHIFQGLGTEMCENGRLLTDP